VLSSKNEGKQEARFATRLDVLNERLDTLAATVATTSSALAKKDGEIVALQRALESRDETLRALVQHVNRAAEVQAADVPPDANELRSLRNAVAALTKERASGVNAGQIEQLVAGLRALDQRVQGLAAAAAAPPAPTTDPVTSARIDALAAELAVVRRTPTGVTEQQLDERVAETSDALANVRRQLDALGEQLERVESTRVALETRLERGLEERDVALEEASRRGDALAAQLSRLGALSDRVGELEQTHGTDLEAADRRSTATDAALERLSHRLDALGDRLGGIESTYAAQDERLDNRFRTVKDTLASLSQRLDAAQSTDHTRLDRRFEESEEALAGLAQRLDAVRETLARMDRVHDVDEERFDQRLAELSGELTALSRRIDAVQGFDETRLERRFEEADGALGKLSQRLDAVAGTVESAAASLGHKEHELAALQRHFTESSTRIETIVDDIRDALHSFGDLESTPTDELAARLERVETATRKSTDSTARTAGELSARIDAIDRRVATVADEVSRAKTLWPVALRSLEARLEDAVHGHRPEGEADPVRADEPSEDLLAGLRDSLQAMESVAAEMARASETLGDPAAETPAEELPAEDVSHGEESSLEPAQHPEAQAAASGATIVPLRAGEP
jgi:chromosome segregation ATPase